MAFATARKCPTAHPADFYLLVEVTMHCCAHFLAGSAPGVQGPTRVRGWTPGDPMLPSPDEATVLSLPGLLQAFRTCGGTLRSDELMVLLQNCGRTVDAFEFSPRSPVFSFRSDSVQWVPLFQFDWSDLTLRPVVSRVVIELRDVLDDFSLAQWFVQPHPCLREARPVDWLNVVPDDVLHAARADRWVIHS